MKLIYFFFFFCHLSITILHMTQTNKPVCLNEKCALHEKSASLLCVLSLTNPNDLFPKGLESSQAGSCCLTSAVLLSNLIYTSGNSKYGAQMTPPQLGQARERERAGRRSCGCALASWLFHCARSQEVLLLPDGPYMVFFFLSVFVCV